MDFLINAAVAADTAAAAPAGSGYIEIGMLVFFVLIFYLMIWRPQAKRAKDHRNLMSSLSQGDEVVTAGGLVGKINEIKDDLIILTVGEQTNVYCQKSAITSVLPKGTLKSLEK
ncbi:MAG: preprotein translocase subunit YajC [Gammaproteobacteria bacterium]|jgi:preprotein translocase subunit YajC